MSEHSAHLTSLPVGFRPSSGDIHVCCLIAVTGIVNFNIKIEIKLAIFWPMWPWNWTDDLEKQWGTSYIPLQALCIITTWYDGFLPPVRCISAPGTTLSGPVVCLDCFNFANIPPPKWAWNSDESVVSIKLNCWDIFNVLTILSSHWN